MSGEQTSVPLTASTLVGLDETIAVPTYDREQLVPSIVHIGVGGFHRAHLAAYVHNLCQAGRHDWSIVGAGVLASDGAMAEALHAQDRLYSLITRDADTTTVEVIGSIVDYVHAAAEPDTLAGRIADPRTQLVSLTVTEGGYPVDDATGAYLHRPPAAGDRSAFGVLAHGLAERRRAGHGALTVVSCDNVVGNGDTARTATLGEADRIDTDLSRWIDETVAFPNSMVDRITPSTTDDDRSWLAATHGLVDRWPVITEPFSHWVIEDRFAGRRPPLEDVGVLVTSDVEPYELMKLRLLNAGHSCLAYLAALLDIETVDAAVADDHLRRYLVGFHDREAKPVMPPVMGIDLDDYTAAVLHRFSNPRIKDQIARLCLDGTAKFPKFLLPTIRAQLAVGGPVALSSLALAGWCEYLNGATRSGRAIDLADDPLLDVAVEHARGSQRDPRAFLTFDAVFERDLANDDAFATAFSRALNLIRERGVRSAIDAAFEEVVRQDDRSGD
ncbi:MAG: mannitol dehydrogenase family protein [Actinomycetota bacterium]